MRRWLIVLPVLVLLFGGCPTPVTLKTVTLNPTALNWSTWYWDASNAWCSVPGGGVWLEGTGPEPVGPGETYSGYEDIYESGPPPAGCTYQEQRLYRGWFAFDLSQFNTIGTAELTFGVGPSIHENGGVNQDNPPQSYATTLGMSTGTSNTGNGSFYWNYDNPANFSCSALTRCSFAVTTQVAQWVSGAHANNGFIIAGPILNFGNSLPSDNNGQVSWYSGFQLQVTYNPAQNPNAPQ
jgi:hypothetical protein